MNVLLGLSHVLIFGLGNAALLPPESALDRYPDAASLIQRVTALPAYRSPDVILLVQQRVLGFLHQLPGELIVSLLSPVVFVVACLMVRALFEAATQSKPAWWPAFLSERTNDLV